MQPVFLMVSNRLDDIKEQLDELLEYIHNVQHPLLSEIRDGINALAGSPTIGDTLTGGYLDQITTNQQSLLVAVALLIGVVLGVGVAWLVTKFWR